MTDSSNRNWIYSAEDIKCTSDDAESLPVQDVSEDMLFDMLSSTAKFCSDANVIKVAVLLVCEKGGQQAYFNSAINKLSIDDPALYKTLRFDYLTNKVIRERNFSPSYISDWLLGSDIHFILSHVHQGLLCEHLYEWNVGIIQDELLRLKYHRGFPNGINLNCSIFLQNKWQYLEAIKDKALPTLRIPLSIDLDCSEVQRKIKMFTEIHVPDEIFIVKLPYTTNSIYTKKVGLESLYSRLRNIQDHWCGVIPYAMVQGFLRNKKEYKVVCLNGKALYDAIIKSPPGSTAFASRSERFEFAESAIRELKLQRPETIIDGIVRVDIMTSDGLTMVVNEFESLEANHGHTAKTQTEFAELSRGLEDYYYNMLLRFCSEITNER